MIGFPTETREEALQTLEWLRSHRDCVDEISLRIFYVDHLSKVFEHPDHYDIERILVDPGKDLQVYYDWIPGPRRDGAPTGMDRREARELFFEFMKALREEFPLFRGDNLLLFELKSHYFLYLCRFGDLSFLERKSEVAVAEPAPAEFTSARLRPADGNALIELPYDLRAVADALNAAECAVLKPRYQSGNFKERLFEEMAARVPAARPCPTIAVYRARSSDLLHVGRDAARLLAAADGSRTVAEILGGFAPAQRPQVETFLRGLLERGLLTAAPLEARSSGPAAPIPPSRPARVPSIAPSREFVGARSATTLEVDNGSAEPARAAETMHLYCKPAGP
jgi:hypothetical protein